MFNNWKKYAVNASKRSIGVILYRVRARLHAIAADNGDDWSAQTKICRRRKFCRWNLRLVDPKKVFYRPIAKIDSNKKQSPSRSYPHTSNNGNAILAFKLLLLVNNPYCDNVFNVFSVEVVPFTYIFASFALIYTKNVHHIFTLIYQSNNTIQ